MSRRQPPVPVQVDRWELRMQVLPGGKSEHVSTFDSKDAAEQALADHDYTHGAVTYPWWPAVTIVRVRRDPVVYRAEGVDPTDMATP